jgi:hypothetical protein
MDVSIICCRSFAFLRSRRPKLSLLPDPFERERCSCIPAFARFLAAVPAGADDPLPGALIRRIFAVLLDRLKAENPTPTKLQESL